MWTKVTITSELLANILNFNFLAAYLQFKTNWKQKQQQNRSRAASSVFMNAINRDYHQTKKKHANEWARQKKKERKKRWPKQKNSLKLRFLALFVSDFLATSTLFSHSYLHIKHATAATFQKWQEFYILWILMIFAAMLCYLSSSEIKTTKFRPGRNSNPLRRRFSAPPVELSHQLVAGDMWVYDKPADMRFS